MNNAKALLVGCVLGVLATLSGVGLAKADCSQDDSRGCVSNYAEKVVVGATGQQVEWCVPDAVAEACIEVSSLLDCSAMSDEACDVTMGVMFEACVQLSYSGAFVASR